MIALKGLCCLFVPVVLIPKVACGAVVVLGVSSMIAGARGLYGLFRLGETMKVTSVQAQPRYGCL